MNDLKRIALISDIHGNVPALTAVLSDIRRNSVNSIICLGDIATLGPSPSETVKIIKDLNCPCIFGNHEEALFSPEKSSEFSIKGAMLQDTIYWCLSKLSLDDILFLKQFNSTLTIPLANEMTMLCYHGSPKSTIDSILPTTPPDQLAQYIDFDESLRVAIGGHTHFQMYRKYKDAIIINTGSVGCAFVSPSLSPPAPSLLPVAEYVIVECNNRNISVELKSIDYDFQEFKTLINNSDTPLKDWWLPEFKRLEQH